MNALEAAKRRAWSDYLAQAPVAQSRPFKAAIEITRNCNYRCVMCPQSWDSRYAEYHPEYNMTPALFEKAASQLFPHLEYAHLQGFGETVISPHWPQILRMCEPYAGSLRLGLVTNMSRHDDVMWRKMMGMGFTVIASYDGATARTFEKIRVRGRFSEVENNLAVCAGEIAAGAPGKLRLLVTLQRDNYRELPLFVEAAVRHRAESVTFSSVVAGPSSPAEAAADLAQLLTPAGAARVLSKIAGSPTAYARRWVKTLAKPATLYGLPPDELRALMGETRRRATDAGVTVVFNDAFLTSLDPAPPRGADSRSLEELDALEGIELSAQVSRFQRCFKPYSLVVVNYKGDVGLCIHLTGDSNWKQMGSLADSSFEEIWNSKTYQEIRLRLTQGQPDNPSCAWCFKHRMAE